LADKAFRRPVGEADLASAPANAKQLRRSLVLVGREHDAEGGDDHIEAGVGEGQRLGVRFLELDRKALGAGADAPTLEEARHVVRRDHIAPTAGCGKRNIAVAGGDIQHLLARANVERFAQLLSDNLQCRADDGIISGGPGAMLAGLQCTEIDLGRRLVLSGDCDCDSHGHSPVLRLPLEFLLDAHECALDRTNTGLTWRPAW
jgi:hypothetical protein